MSAWSGLIHQISQGVTNQVVSSLKTRLSRALAPPPSSKATAPTSLDLAHSAMDEILARVRAKHATAWANAANPVTDGGNGAELAAEDARRTKAAEASHAKLANAGDVPEFKSQSALGELLASLAAAAKSAVAPIAARGRAVLDTTQGYLNARRREFKSLDNLDDKSPNTRDEYEAAKRRTRNARRAWTNALAGRGDVVNAAKQRYGEAKAEAASDPTNAAKSARKADTLADLQRATSLAGGGLSKSLSGGLGQAGTALGKAGGHLGRGFVGFVGAAKSKLGDIGGTIGAGLLKAIPAIGLVAGIGGAVVSAVGGLSRMVSGRIGFLTSTHDDDPRVFAATQRRAETTANLHRLMSRDTAESTTALVDARDVNRRKLQPWQAWWENQKTNAATGFERAVTFGLDLTDAVGDQVSSFRKKTQDAIDAVPGLRAALDFIGIKNDLTDEEKKSGNSKEAIAARVLARAQAADKAREEFSVNSAMGLRNLGDHFSGKMDIRDQNKRKPLLKKVK